MLVSRILGGLGRFFISLGVLTLLFVAYQLWGTGILTAQAQNKLENQFEDLLVEADQLVDNEPVAASTPGAEDPADADATPVLTRADRRELARLLWQDDGDAVAQIFAPTIDLDWLVVAGVGSEALTKGPGHYSGTPLPGMPGNASIAGHRTTWGAPFNRIDELAPGDEITMKTLQGTFTYVVVEQENGEGHFIVSPDRVDVLDQDFELYPNRLTLTACHPKFTARQRIIVVAELVGDPAPYIAPPGDDVEPLSLPGEGFGSDGSVDDDVTAAPAAPGAGEENPDATGDSGPSTGAAGEGDAGAAPDAVTSESAPSADLISEENFGEGLNGDRDAILPSFTWAFAALTIWATAAFAASRWRWWPSYVIGITPFLAVLFVCFVHIDRAIPSY